MSTPVDAAQCPFNTTEYSAVRYVGMMDNPIPRSSVCHWERRRSDRTAATLTPAQRRRVWLCTKVFDSSHSPRRVVDVILDSVGNYLDARKLWVADCDSACFLQGRPGYTVRRGQPMRGNFPVESPDAPRDRLRERLPVGTFVRVRGDFGTPYYGWGMIRPRMVGRVDRVVDDTTVLVSFREQTDPWTGKVHELLVSPEPEFEIPNRLTDHDPVHVPNVSIGAHAGAKRKGQETPTGPRKMTTNVARLDSYKQPQTPLGLGLCFCAEEHICTVFVACGHATACLECAKRLDRTTHTCPQCREKGEIIGLYATPSQI